MPTRCVPVCTRECNNSGRTHSCRRARSAAQHASCRARACVSVVVAACQGAGPALLVPAVIPAHAHTCVCRAERVWAPCAGQDAGRDGRSAAGRVRRVRLLLCTSQRRRRRRRRRRLRCVRLPRVLGTGCAVLQPHMVPAHTHARHTMPLPASPHLSPLHTCGPSHRQGRRRAQNVRHAGRGVQVQPGLLPRLPVRARPW
jgi:hypothetical protein